MRLMIAGMAHGHVQYILTEAEENDQIELVGTADADPENRAKWTPEGVPSYADHRDALNDLAPDVVAVCGIYGERAAATVAALEAGAHVIADKPLCTTVAQLDEIERAAQKANRQVSVIFEKRWYPVTTTARRLVAEGVIGDLTLVAATGPHKAKLPSRPDWFFTDAGYGHVLGDLPVHDIDLVLALTGASSGTVTGSTPPPTQPAHPEWHDAGALLMTADSVTATMEAHWLWPEASEYHGRYQMRLTGTKGVIEIDWAKAQVSVETHEHQISYPELDEGLRPAQQALSALAQGQVPEVNTAASVAATRIALLAAQSATGNGERLNW